MTSVLSVFAPYFRFFGASERLCFMIGVFPGIFTYGICSMGYVL